jgi:hypothetical protein
MLEQALRDDRLFVVLRALNTISSLGIEDLPSGMMDRLGQLQEARREEWDNTDYIHNAAVSIESR